MDNFFTFLEIYWYVASQKPHIQSIAARSKSHVFKLGGISKLHQLKNHVSKPIYHEKWKIIGRNTVKTTYSKHMRKISQNHVSKL